MINKINISPPKQKLILYIVLTVVTLAVFWQVNQFDFVNFDDVVYVTENSHIQSGITLDGMIWAFSTKYFGLWNPLVWLSLMVDYELYGLNAGGYHRTNLILHVMSTLLLFWLFNRMTGAIWKSAFVAALFALHPLHVESVAWISERKDVLSAFFWMLTLCLYVYYTEKPLIRRYLLTLLSFVCALMSKPIVVTLPVIMILLDYWPLERFKSQKSNLIISLLREKIPFLILSTVLVIFTLYAPDKQSLEGFPLDSRFANVPASFMTYLEKTFWPHDLAVFYPFSNQLPVWQVLGSAMLILVISIAVIIVLKRLPYLFVGWFWYAITILPVIKIIQVGNDAMADRYHYLPSIGISIMLAWSIPLLFQQQDLRKKILFPAGMAVIAILAILASRQCGYWKNSIELWIHTLQVTKNNYLAHGNLGLALFEEGKAQEAIGHYNKAIGIKTNYILAYYNRAIAYAELGRQQLAIEDYNKVIRLKPDYIFAYNNRGIAYAELGQYQRAIVDFNATIRLKSDFAKAYYGRGSAYHDLGQCQLAVKDFNEAIRLKPDFASSYNNRGIAYFELGKNNLGCRDAQKACALGICKLFEVAKSKGFCR